MPKQKQSVESETPEETVDQQRKPGYSADGVHRGKANLMPFKPGQSGNPNGRPRDIVRDIGRNIAAASGIANLTPRERRRALRMGFNPDEITLIETIMIQLATSRNPVKIALFLERTFGKVPNVNLNAKISEDLVQRFKHKLTDSELESIAAGADVFEVLLDKLPDVDDPSIVDATTLDDE